MNKDQLIQQIELGLSTWKLAEYFSITQPNIRYWLKKFKLETKRKFNDSLDKKLCPYLNYIITIINLCYNL